MLCVLPLALDVADATAATPQRAGTASAIHVVSQKRESSRVTQ